MTVYLDHAATTPMRPEAVAAMLPFLTDRFGNPSGSHAVSRDAKKALEDARETVAGCLGCEPHEVVFTGSGTESDNMAITGVVAESGRPAVCSAVEHHAVLHTVAAHGGTVVPVDASGIIDLDALAAVLDHADVAVVSLMLANNEVGVIQPLADAVRLVRARRPGALVHTDAVQAFPWVDVAARATGADLVSVSAHKFGGPKGVGALIARNTVRISPVIHGGGQEEDRRSGTHNVAGIVAMAEAMRITVAERDEVVRRVGELRDALADRIVHAVPGAVETGARQQKIAGNCHLRLPGVESEALLVLLDDAGVCASAGSACASGALEPSHVLAAMGIPRHEAAGSLRLSLGPSTTMADVELAAKAVIDSVERLREPA